MHFLNKLERRFGKYAISNISLMLIICYGFGYAISLVNEAFLSFLTLNPWLIIHGQIWRLFTWILVPPSEFSFWTLISLYFYYSIGSALERTWGAFKYNVFLFLGMLFTIIGSFIMMGYYIIACGNMVGGMGGIGSLFSSQGMFLYQAGIIPPIIAFNMITTYYVNLSIFLGFALTYPDAMVFLFFIIPVKMKWLGALYVGLTLYSFVMSPLPIRVLIAASLLNVVIFFFLTRQAGSFNPMQVKRKVVYRAKTMTPRSSNRHKCSICGRTEEDGANLEFRFCSKCNGNYEYCQDHLFTHEHVK